MDDFIFLSTHILVDTLTDLLTALRLRAEAADVSAPICLLDALGAD